MRRPIILSAALMSLLLAAHAMAQEALERAEAQVRDPFAPTAKAPAALSKADTPEPGYLGVVADDSGPGDGVRITDIKPGGPADVSGLKRSDLVDDHQRRSDPLASRFRRAAECSHRRHQGDVQDPAWRHANDATGPSRAARCAGCRAPAGKAASGFRRAPRAERARRRLVIRVEGVTEEAPADLSEQRMIAARSSRA